MKISLQWLRERVALPRALDEVVSRFTLAGLECEGEAVCADAELAGVVVGHIVGVEPHPDADKLRVCAVDYGAGEPAQVVCGAANAAPGLRAPLALPGAVLPDGREIAAASLRGVDSHGMLCSAAELGLGEGSEGLLVLDETATPGTPLSQWLALDDDSIVFELTPNRGDCLSLRGLAREAGVLFAQPVDEPEPVAVTPAEDVSAPEVELEQAGKCPVYCARRIEGVDAGRRSPDWLRERLRRSGVRSVSAVVDITNLVMLELGQPLHAFDADRLSGGIRVRDAAAGERLRLINEQECTLSSRDLVIADAAGPVALAGVMGGGDSEVGPATRSLLLEAACFLPAAVAGTGRRHKLHTDAVHRFERGVDPRLAERAIERCTALILELCGGRAGPVTRAGQPPEATAPVPLRRERMAQLLGVAIADDQVSGILTRLGMTVTASEDGWQVVPPSWRYDIEREVDLIEEVARIVGYDAIGSSDYHAAPDPQPLVESQRSDGELRELLAARGFQDVVSYSFVDSRLDARLQPETPRLALDNPIAATMDCMRTTLWSGLLPVAQYNLQRQQRRLKLFELARVYLPPGEAGGAPQELPRLALLMTGPAAPEHWSGRLRPADFYDLKGELNALLPRAECRAAAHPALHPGRSAQVFLEGRAVGWMGELHPEHARALDINQAVLLLEIEAAAARQSLQAWQPIAPEYPASRRDIALEVPEEVTCGELIEDTCAAAPEILRDVVVFDLYRGENLKSGCKGIALGLIFQDYSRTLTEQDIERATKLVTEALCKRRGATIRG